MVEELILFEEGVEERVEVVEGKEEGAGVLAECSVLAFDPALLSQLRGQGQVTLPAQEQQQRGDRA